MLTIVLIGTGNVASHLFTALLNMEDVAIKQVFGRNQKALDKFSVHCQATSNPDDIVNADLYLIAVSDQAIASVSELIGAKKGIIAHTSGSVPLDAITHKRAAVLYPLQTFTTGKEIDFKEIPVCIESKNKKDMIILKNLVEGLSDSVYQISSKQRKKLHLAAVFANNFSNHLFYIAQKICESENLPFEALKPLILETTSKLQLLSPEQAQTGPAKRNDVQTMQEHMTILEKPIQKKIYQLLSESIKTTHEEKL